MAAGYVVIRPACHISGGQQHTITEHVNLAVFPCPRPKLITIYQRSRDASATLYPTLAQWWVLERSEVLMTMLDDNQNNPEGGAGQKDPDRKGE
ncbi:MAG: hypothetical protein BroJett015_33010 [Chloroflexota bacterium]|nr:MAG: hypothetical protein BroJett015_33010 [Chloroflexota bacterium]